MTATITRKKTCPAWCCVASSPCGHPSCIGVVADWEGPAGWLVEVDVVRRGDLGEVLVEVERFNSEGETTVRRIVSLTPAQAAAAGAFLAGYDDRLSGALLTAADLLGPLFAPAD